MDPKYLDKAMAEYRRLTGDYREPKELPAFLLSLIMKWAKEYEKKEGGEE